MRTPASTKRRYRKAPYDKKREEESGWYALAAAIVQQAVEDYRTAEKMLANVPTFEREGDSWAYICRLEKEKHKIVAFFKGQWYATICDIDPDLILRKLGVRV